MTYSDIAFVKPDDLGYKKFCRQHAQRKRIYKTQNKKDPFEILFNKALHKWENVMQTLLSKIRPEQKNRILQYRGKRGFIQYREIDFIAKLDNNNLVLCEIKLKQNYDEKRLHLGWKQLNESLLIAGNKYNPISGLAICIDMSYVYGINKITDKNVYCDYSDIENYFSLSFSENNTIWLNSLDIARVAVKYNLLTNEDIHNMKNIFNQKTNPLSIFKGNKKPDYDNNPFVKALKNLKT